MFNFLWRNKKCPICKMEVSKGAIAKYGEKFCSAGCLEKYEKKNVASNKKELPPCCHGHK